MRFIHPESNNAVPVDHIYNAFFLIKLFRFRIHNSHSLRFVLVKKKKNGRFLAFLNILSPGAKRTFHTRRHGSWDYILFFPLPVKTQHVHPKRPLLHLKICQKYVQSNSKHKFFAPIKERAALA